MHILLNFRVPKHGRILTYAVAISQYLMKQGHTSTVVFTDSTNETSCKLYGVDYQYEFGNEGSSDLFIDLADFDLGEVKEAIDRFLANPPTLTGKHFLRQCLGLYELHTRKAADYGSGAITMTGLEGVLTRTWDKMARLLHLSGYRYELKMKPRDKAKEPNNESVLDTWRDLAAYALIALVHANRQEGEES